MGIEPTLFAWEAKVLPLNYTRVVWILKGNKTPWRIFGEMCGAWPPDVIRQLKSLLRENGR